MLHLFTPNGNGNEKNAFAIVLKIIYFALSVN